MTLVVELLAEWGEFAGEAEHDSVMDMAVKLAEEGVAEARKLGKSGGWPVVPKVKYRAVSPTAQVKSLQAAASSYFVNDFVAVRTTAGKNENLPLNHLIIASQVVIARPNQHAEDCVLFTNAPITELEGCDRFVIVSSGNVEARSTLDYSVVVCRGDVTYRTDPEESSLIKAGGRVLDTGAVESNGKRPGFPPDPKRVFPGDAKLMGVKFYSAAEDGLEATAAKEVVTATKVDANKLFGKAGVKVGDEVELVNGEPVRTLHDLDRLVCRATVSTGVAKLRLKRGKETVVVEAKLADW